MLRLIAPPPDRPLDAAERHGLSILLDLSRIVAADTVADATPLRVVEEGQAVPIRKLPARHGIRTVAGEVIIERWLLSTVTSIVGAVAEQQSSRADKYGRVPHDDNDCVRGGVAREPVIHRLAVALRDAVIAAAGRRPVALVAPWPSGHRWAVAMTHDLDVVARWPVFTALRLAELLKRGEVGRMAGVVSAGMRSTFGDPVWDAARQVLEIERRAGMHSTWFIITGTPTFQTMKAGDITYVPESPAARRIIQAAADAGHEIGLHGSFATFDTPSAFVEQRERLTVLAQRPVHGIRQHFIRMRPGTTHRQMFAAGFQYDSTFGFSDRNGFRLGIADVVPVWDHATARALDIDELPFVWMDRALSKYRGVENPDAWVDDALGLAAACADVGGAWCGIWHPNLATPLGFPGALDAFRRLCMELMASNPWSASVGDIVRWRRMRRQVRATDVRNGRPRVSVPAGPHDVALEDATGRPIPFERA